MKWNVMILMGIALAFSGSSCLKEEEEDTAVEKCDKNNPDYCSEFRIVDMPDGRKSYDLGTISVLVKSGTFPGSDVMIDLDFFDITTVPTCGGTVTSKAYHFTAKNTDGLISRDDIPDDKWMEVRHNTNAIQADRAPIYAITLRSPGSAAAAFYLDSTSYFPQGETATDETSVFWYNQESDAVFYIINVTDSISSECQKLPEPDPEDIE